eukprot:Opistho-2@58835
MADKEHVESDGEGTAGAAEVEAAEKKITTALEDPHNYTIKHPLEHKWVLWYDNPGKKVDQSSWELSLKRIIDFDTVEDFWAVYNNIVPASRLATGSNYHLFRDGIQPKWEDSQNKYGGKWVWMIPKTTKKEKIDEYWLYTMLSVIGESMDEHGNEVCGAVVSIRKPQSRLAVWTRTSDNQATAESIGRRFKEALCAGVVVTLNYQVHNDALRSNKSYSNRPLYEV